MGKTIMTPERTREAIEMRIRGMSWQDIGDTFGCSDSTASRACYAIGRRSPTVQVALKKIATAAIRTGSNNSRHCYVKPEISFQAARQIFSESYDNKLTGTPPLARSALKDIETDGRGNIAKSDLFSGPLGPIRIPDIRINSSHSTVQARAVA